MLFFSFINIKLQAMNRPSSTVKNEKKVEIFL